MYEGVDQPKRSWKAASTTQTCRLDGRSRESKYQHQRIQIFDMAISSALHESIICVVKVFCPSQKSLIIYNTWSLTCCDDQKNKCLTS